MKTLAAVIFDGVTTLDIAGPLEAFRFVSEQREVKPIVSRCGALIVNLLRRNLALCYAVALCQAVPPDSMAY